MSLHKQPGQPFEHDVQLHVIHDHVGKFHVALLHNIKAPGQIFLGTLAAHVAEEFPEIYEGWLAIMKAAHVAIIKSIYGEDVIGSNHYEVMPDGSFKKTDPIPPNPITKGAFREPSSN